MHPERLVSVGWRPERVELEGSLAGHEGSSVPLIAGRVLYVLTSEGLNAVPVAGR